MQGFLLSRTHLWLLMLHVTAVRPTMSETTALGAAVAAGAAEGVDVWSLRPGHLPQLKSETFQPQINVEGENSSSRASASASEYIEVRITSSQRTVACNSQITLVLKFGAGGDRLSLTIPKQILYTDSTLLRLWQQNGKRPCTVSRSTDGVPFSPQQFSLSACHKHSWRAKNKMGLSFLSHPAWRICPFRYVAESQQPSIPFVVALTESFSGFFP